MIKNFLIQPILNTEEIILINQLKKHMAYLEGTLDEIYKYLGPRTSDIVTQLAKPHRKNANGNRRSCAKDNCKQYTGLHAAHLKGRERKVLIKEILDHFGFSNSDGTYKIDLKIFEEEFKKKHDSFFEVIMFMCPKHHKQYDLKNDIEDLDEKPILDIEEIEEILEITQLLEENNSVDILLSNKDFIINKLVSIQNANNLEDIIPILADSKKCKELFNLDFPILISENLISEDLYRRYYSKESFKDKKGDIYKITNHWFKEQRDLFNNWLQKNIL